MILAVASSILVGIDYLTSYAIVVRHHYSVWHPGPYNVGGYVDSGRGGFALVGYNLWSTYDTSSILGIDYLTSYAIVVRHHYSVWQSHAFVLYCMRHIVHAARSRRGETVYQYTAQYTVPCASQPFMMMMVAN